MTLGHLSKQELRRIVFCHCSYKPVIEVILPMQQGAAMALAELDSPLVEECLRKLANDESKDSLIREVAEASLARRESLNLV